MGVCFARIAAITGDDGSVNVQYVSAHCHSNTTNELGSIPLPTAARQAMAERLHMGQSIEKILEGTVQPRAK